MTATAKIKPEKYAELLAAALPRVIRTEKENDRMLAEIAKYMRRGEDNLSPEEAELVELMSTLVEAYEDEHYPMDEAPPHQVLRLLMSEHGVKQKDLLHIFGSSGIASEVVNGKRAISKKQAKALAEFFHVSPEVFI